MSSRKRNSDTLNTRENQGSKTRDELEELSKDIEHMIKKLKKAKENVSEMLKTHETTTQEVNPRDEPLEESGKNIEENVENNAQEAKPRDEPLEEAKKNSYSQVIFFHTMMLFNRELRFKQDLNFYSEDDVLYMASDSPKPEYNIKIPVYFRPATGRNKRRKRTHYITFDIISNPHEITITDAKGDTNFLSEDTCRHYLHWK